ncbi:hypothetical protein OROMI_009306 [Orobanche minor]
MNFDSNSGDATMARDWRSTSAVGQGFESGVVAATGAPAVVVRWMAHGQKRSFSFENPATAVMNECSGRGDSMNRSRTSFNSGQCYEAGFSISVAATRAST